MKSWIRRAARLYPRRWRDRYGAEFEALLDDLKPGWRELIDVTKGALVMRLRYDSTSFKFAAAMALAGAVLAAGVSLAVPNRYVSTAVMRIRPAPDTDAPDWLSDVQQAVLSRGSLAELIQRRDLNLYPGERQRMPMEDVIERMRRDIQIRMSPGTPGVITVSFAYSDKEKAQATARELVRRMTDLNVALNNMRAAAWRVLSPDAPMPPGDTFGIVDPPSLAQRATEQNRGAIIASGLVAGLLLGLAGSWLKRRLRWTLHIAGFAGTGAAAAALVSFLLPATYLSTAVMLIRPPLVPARYLGAMAPEPIAQWLPNMTQEALSRDSLMAIMHKFDLYPKERARKPEEEVLDTMAHAIWIRRLAQSQTFSISFRYPEPEKAQLVVAALISRIADQNTRAERAKWRNAHEPEAVGNVIDRKMGAVLEVLDSASLPEHPISPNRVIVTALGIVAGWILGAITFSVRQANQHRPA
jgi:hypothetical protein